MKAAEQKIMLRTMVGSDDQEAVLDAYLTIAGQKILTRAYPFDQDQTQVPERYHVLQCEIAAYLMNKRGADGQITHSENGISRQYENGDVPESMLSAVTPCCGVIR